MGSRSSYRPPLAETPELHGHDKLPAVGTSSDLALLSSIGTQLEEIGRRITDLAESYGQTPDSAIASELFGAERALFGARRSLDRARALLEDT
jgi:hypothetical protein